MSLGDYNKGNKDNNKSYSKEVYSTYNMSNAFSEIDATALSTSFFNKMLKISIAPKTPNSDPNKPEWDKDSTVTAYLTHIKARMLLEEILIFEKDPSMYANVGVPTGSGLVSISNGRELGANVPCLIIRKLNSETGEIESSYAYEFKQDFHYTIRNFNSDDLEFDKAFYNNLELDQFKTLLKSYYESMTNATAYSVMEQLKYDNSRINTKLDSVCEKLGIEYKKGGNSSNYNKSSNNMFNNKEPRNTFNSGTIDDIMG